MLLRCALRQSVVALVLMMSPAFAASSPEQRGKAFAKTHCARCHSIGLTGASPFKPAPPFRTLHLHYPIEGLEEALAEGIVTGHPAMPEFVLTPNQIRDFLSFLKTLE